MTVPKPGGKTRGRRSSNRRVRPSGHPRARATARLAAVQALYQMDMAETPIGDALAQYLSAPPLLDEAEDERADVLDADFFAELVRGAWDARAELDDMMKGGLDDDWPFERIEPLHRALLRAALFELWRRSEIPAKTIMNEYVDIAHAFYDGVEVAMSNALLGKVAKRLREAELHGGPG